MLAGEPAACSRRLTRRRSIQRGATSTRVLPTFVVLGLVGLAGCGAASQAEVVESDQARHTIAVEQASAVPDVVGATDRLGMDLLALTPAENNAVTSPWRCWAKVPAG